MRYIQALLLLYVALAATEAGAAERIRCPERVRVGFHDFNTPGFLNGAGPSFENPPGKLVDWTRATLAGIPCKTQLDMVRLPLHRVILETEGNPIAKDKGWLLSPATAVHKTWPN